MTYIPLEWMIVYYVIMNVVGLSMLLWDLHLLKIKSHKWVSEVFLLLVGVLGGAPAMMVAMFVTRHKLRYPKFYLTLPCMTLLHAGLIAVVALFGPRFSYQLQVDTTYLIVYLLAVSLVAVILTFVDKRRAQQDLYRLSEDTLLLWAVLGGSVAMFGTMIMLRHKTRHLKFMLGLPIMIVIQGAIFYWLWEFSNFIYFYY